MPREFSTAPYERPHPYPTTARPPPSLQDPPAEPSNHPEPSPANESESDGHDSDNEEWLDFLEESTHGGCKFYPPSASNTISDGYISLFCSSWLC